MERKDFYLPQEHSSLLKISTMVPRTFSAGACFRASVLAVPPLKLPRPHGAPLTACGRFLSTSHSLSSCLPLFAFGAFITCCCSVAQSCPTLCDPMDCSMPGFPVLHHLPDLLKLVSIESVMPSSHLILCHPLLLTY